MTGTRRTSNIEDTQFMTLLKSTKIRKPRKSIKPDTDTNQDDNIEMDTDVIQVEQPIEKPVKKVSKKVSAKKPAATKKSTETTPTPTPSAPIDQPKTTENEQQAEEVVITEKQPIENIVDDEVIITKDLPAPTPKPSKEEDVPKAKEEQNNDTTTTTTTTNTPTVNKMKRTIKEIDPSRGKPVSGRVWKTPSSKLNSAIKSKGFKQSFENKQKQRVDLKRMKDKEREIKEKTKLDKTLMHNAIRENKRIKEENLKKSEVVQVINNTQKLKKLSKKDWKLYRKN
ncbi:hypothetical protein ACTFIW_010291 [Dictyostelium discoideum]